MGRPKKHVAASKSNGSKASNKGKITSAKVKVICAKVQWRRGEPAITFETKFRAKLHKKMKYEDQEEAEAWAAEAAQVVKDAERGAHSAADSDGMSLETAREILKAYQDAERDPE